MLTIYSFLYSIVLIFLFPFEYRKRPRELRKQWLAEKLGVQARPVGSRPPSASSSYPTGGGSASGLVPPSVWVHAVSVGEVIAAVSFIRVLKERHPELRIVVSTITDTGRKVAEERLGETAEIVYLPFDLRVFLRRAVRMVKPLLFAVMETEIWPNMLRTMKSAGIPVVVLNGRISEKSFNGYRKVRFLMRRILRNVDFFCMQDELYAERAKHLGAREDKVINAGSFKFDFKVKDEELTWGAGLEGPVVIAGSTHRGEDGLMVSAYKRLREDFRELNLIIAPRHPQRFDEVEEILKSEGALYVRRSLIKGSENISGMVVLLDTMGELSSVYRISDIAVMGGSFIRHGGQNPLEPAYFGKPVVCGPHMGNFPFIRDFYDQGAAVETDEEGLYDVLKELLSSPEKRQAIGEKANDILMKNRGAVERAVRVVEHFLENPAGKQ